MASGSCGGALSTMVAPQAIAGASLWAASSTGKLNGMMAEMGESGNRRVMPQRRSPCGWRSMGITSPPIRTASCAPWRKTNTARSISARASASGFPASAARRLASDSRRSATPAAIRSSTAARAWDGSAAAAGAAATAASRAAATSSGPASSGSADQVPGIWASDLHRVGAAPQLAAQQEWIGAAGEAAVVMGWIPGLRRYGRVTNPQV